MHKRLPAGGGNPGLKVELNPLDCWAAGPCCVLVGHDHVDLPSSLQSEEKAGHFQPGVQRCS